MCGGACRPESPAEAACDSDRGHGKKHDVLNKAYFLLHERFGVAHTRKQTVVPRFSESSLANLFFGNEEIAALRLRGILRAIGKEGLQALLDVGCDVDGEGGSPDRPVPVPPPRPLVHDDAGGDHAPNDRGDRTCPGFAGT